MLDFIGKYWVPLWTIISILFFGLMWAMRKTYASKAQVDELENRVNSIENEVKQLPSKDDVHQLELTVNTANGKLDAVAQQLLKLQRTTEMLLENELKGDK